MKSEASHMKEVVKSYTLVGLVNQQNEQEHDYQQKALRNIEEAALAQDVDIIEIGD